MGNCVQGGTECECIQLIFSVLCIMAQPLVSPARSSARKSRSSDCVNVCNVQVWDRHALGQMVSCMHPKVLDRIALTALSRAGPFAGVLGDDDPVIRLWPAFANRLQLSDADAEALFEAYVGEAAAVVPFLFDSPFLSVAHMSPFLRCVGRS